MRYDPAQKDGQTIVYSEGNKMKQVEGEKKNILNLNSKISELKLKELTQFCAPLKSMVDRHVDSLEPITDQIINIMDRFSANLENVNVPEDEAENKTKIMKLVNVLRRTYTLINTDRSLNSMVHRSMRKMMMRHGKSNGMGDHDGIGGMGFGGQEGRGDGGMGFGGFGGSGDEEMSYSSTTPGWWANQDQGGRGNGGQGGRGNGGQGWGGNHSQGQGEEENGGQGWGGDGGQGWGGNRGQGWGGNQSQGQGEEGNGGQGWGGNGGQGWGGNRGQGWGGNGGQGWGGNQSQGKEEAGNGGQGEQGNGGQGGLGNGGQGGRGNGGQGGRGNGGQHGKGKDGQGWGGMGGPSKPVTPFGGQRPNSSTPFGGQRPNGTTPSESTVPLSEEFGPREDPLIKRFGTASYEEITQIIITSNIQQMQGVFSNKDKVMSILTGRFDQEQIMNISGLILKRLNGKGVLPDTSTTDKPFQINPIVFPSTDFKPFDLGDISIESLPSPEKMDENMLDALLEQLDKSSIFGEEDAEMSAWDDTDNAVLMRKKRQVDLNNKFKNIDVKAYIKEGMKRKMEGSGKSFVMHFKHMMMLNDDMRVPPIMKDMARFMKELIFMPDEDPSSMIGSRIPAKLRSDMRELVMLFLKEDMPSDILKLQQMVFEHIGKSIGKKVFGMLPITEDDVTEVMKKIDVKIVNKTASTDPEEKRLWTWISRTQSAIDKEVQENLAKVIQRIQGIIQFLYKMTF